jgi:hypothetical protein
VPRTDGGIDDPHAMLEDMTWKIAIDYDAAPAGRLARPP